MIFHIISVLIPVLALTLFPMMLKKIAHVHAPRNTILFSAAFLFFISWYLPSPLIDGKETQFMTHFVGGGIFTGLLWLYLKQVLVWRPKWAIIVEPFSLFALVSALGVANELFELTITQLHIVNMDLSDTPWDLVANTSGALVFYGLYALYRRLRQPNNT